MPAMSIDLNGDGVWPDLVDKPVIHVTSTIKVAVLPNGMASGKPSVCFRITLPGGETVLAETSAALFTTMARLVEAKYPQLKT